MWRFDERPDEKGKNEKTAQALSAKGQLTKTDFLPMAMTVRQGVSGT